MPTDGSDAAPHITADFPAAFPSWRALRHHLAECAAHPEYDLRRATQQVLMADLVARLPDVATGRWLLLGSLSLPARIDPQWRWPGGYPDRPPLTQAQVMSRPAFDLDLCHLEQPDQPPEGYGQRVVAALHRIAPPRGGGEPGRAGLDGLVRYSSELRVVADGHQVMGLVIAQPVGSDGARPVDDPIALEVDIKPRTKVVFAGEPDQPLQPFLGLDIAGLRPPPLPMFPVEYQFADKATLLTGPARSLRPNAGGLWHRYKDLVDLYLLTQAVPLDAGRLQAALANNWNLARMNRAQVPTPYRVYGDHSRPGDHLSHGEPEIDWAAGIDQLRVAAPQLTAYPSFHEITAQVGRCIDDLHNVAADAHWVPGHGWSRNQARSPDSALTDRGKRLERLLDAAANPRPPDELSLS